MAWKDYQDQIQKIYIAYYQRPADPRGLVYWATRLDAAGGDLRAIIEAFANSEESRSLYGTITKDNIADVVKSIYRALFNRDPEDAGLNYYVNGFKDGKFTAATIMLDILNGAQNEDKLAIQNKLKAANLFTETIDPGLDGRDIQATYNGDTDAAKARDWLKNVTWDPWTLPTESETKDFIKSNIADSGDPILVVQGQTFTLTAGVDNLTGTSGDDTFVADDTQSPQVTSVADVLNGGYGTDTLIIYGTPHGIPQLSSIENVVLDMMGDGGSANLGSVSGVQKLTLSRALGAATVTVADGVAVTISSNAASNKDITINFGANDTSVNLTLDKVNIGTLDLSGGGAKVATVNVGTTGSASSVSKLKMGATTNKLLITGDKDLTIGTDFQNSGAVTVDASGFTGKLTLTTDNNAPGSATAPGLVIKSGSGDDTIDIRASDEGDYTSVDAGAGDDTVVVRIDQIYNDTTETLVGGDGTDTLRVDFANSDKGFNKDLSGTITGFEVLEVTSNGTQDRMHTVAMGMSKLGISQFVVNGDKGDTFAFTGLAANSTITVKSDQKGVSAEIGTDTDADVINFVLDGTTIGTLTATNYETVNITSQKDTSGKTNELTTVSMTAAKTVNLTGSGNLVGGTITLAKGAVFNASTYTGDLTDVKFDSSLKSYTGGSGKDEITLCDGDLKQGNTFAGGDGTDKLTVTTSSNQEMGIIGLTGFETVKMKISGAVVGDFRNVTGLNTLMVTTTAADDDLTLYRLSADTTVSFGTDIDQVVITINSGTSQKVAFHDKAKVNSLTLDLGTETLTVTSDNGDLNEDEEMGSFSSISGSSLARIIVEGKDRTNLGTLSTTVTTVDASAAKGALTVKASSTGTTIIGSQAGDSITGGAGNDVIRGGKGNDTLDGGGASDTYVFEATGDANGKDTITMVAGASGDKLNFSAFFGPGVGSVDQKGGQGTVIFPYTSADTNDVNITNKVALYSDENFDGTATPDEIAGLIEGSGNAFSLTAGGKAIVITG
ncbi:MAG: DUF4214 domain-containing protein, partial [Thermofilaceae archaeon]